MSIVVVVVALGAFAALVFGVPAIFASVVLFVVVIGTAYMLVQDRRSPPFPA